MSVQEDKHESETMLSIGGLSKATGVPVETLRTWERRYGFPEPERSPSGHRRYHLSTVERLRLMTRAMDLGHKPSTVVGADSDDLRELLEISAARHAPLRGIAHGEEPVPSIEADQVLAAWHQEVMRFDANGLERNLRRHWSAIGAMPFLTGLVGPFLEVLGQRWSRGELSVRHEHFASERLRDFLTAQWRPLSDSARGPRLVCATLSGEQHVLGLHMAAVALALANVRVVFLGTDVPTPDIAAAAHDFAASAIVISVSAAAHTEKVRAQLTTLRRNLDPSIPLVAGGSGVPEGVNGVVRFASLTELQRWADGL